jgi:DNA helicase-2/ATP-dependent DNA helicase PcrA
VVEAITAFATSCRSLQELETKIADQSVALREVPENAVVLSTIHSAKGLEWEAVFVVGMEEGVLPHANNDDLEEERRVAYVAATRAKRVLGLTYANVRFGQNSTPSRFLDELAGKERRHCVWTGSRSDAADERLPLLSDRERQRLSEGLVPEQPSKRSAVTRGRRAKDKSDRGNKSKGAPARHGLAWSAEEDSRLRNMFLSGAAIPAIAQAHQRKRGAITSRLVKLGLVEDRESPRFD